MLHWNSSIVSRRRPILVRSLPSHIFHKLTRTYNRYSLGAESCIDDDIPFTVNVLFHWSCALLMLLCHWWWVVVVVYWLEMTNEKDNGASCITLTSHKGHQCYCFSGREHPGMSIYWICHTESWDSPSLALIVMEVSGNAPRIGKWSRTQTEVGNHLGQLLALVTPLTSPSFALLPLMFSVS